MLQEIGVELRDYILVLNKVDAVDDRSVIDLLRARYTDAISINPRRLDRDSIG